MRPLYVCRTGPTDWCLAESVPEEDDMRQLDAGGLVPLIEKVADRLKARRPDQFAHFTFSARDFRDVLNNGDPDDPAELGAHLAALRARGVIPQIVTLLMPIGDEDQPDLWATVFWSSSSGGRFYSAGPTSYLRGHVVERRLLEMLEHPKSGTYRIRATLGRSKSVAAARQHPM
jgi:hypothetical protein